MNKIDKLDSNRENLDKKSSKIYNKILKESLDLENAIEEERTDNKTALESIFYMINKIFCKKVKSPESDTDKKRVLENTKKQKKNMPKE